MNGPNTSRASGGVAEISPKPAKPRKLTREEQAVLEVGHTNMATGTAVLLTLIFLATILAVPVGDYMADLRRSAAKDPTADDVRPAVYDVVDLAPSMDEIRKIDSAWAMYKALPTPAQLSAFETSLEERSALAQWLTPRVQWLLTSYGRVGNEQATTGRNGWLFYVPAVSYLTGEPFLDHKLLAKTVRFTDRSPDPIAAIVDLRKQLADRGIDLVLMPTPGKAQIHPEMAWGSVEQGIVLQNPSYSAFMEALKKEGINVFDPGPLLVSRKASGQQYLSTDTHWMPQAMAATAAELAQKLRSTTQLPKGETARYTRGKQLVSNLGDIAAMLKLPPDQEIFPLQEVTIEPVMVDGADWAASKGAPVLLLGDSFSNIYSLKELGWGERAGFAEQLSLNLGLPVDRIVINAGGAQATRQSLAAELARNPRRLDGVKVVVWEFAQRELLEGDWKLITLPSGGSTPSVQTPAAGETRMVIRGTIAAIGRPPQPGTVPYRDCLVAVHLTGVGAVSGKTDQKEVMAFVYGMKDNRLTPASRWAVGQQVELDVTPWDSTEKGIRAIQQQMTDTDADLTVNSWWFSPTTSQK